MRWRRWILGITLTGMAIMGALTPAWADEEIIVSAAASLTQSLGQAAKAFESAHPGTRVRLNLGASGNLLQQIVAGAPVDVFVSADEAFMDKGAKEGVILPATRRDLVSNRVVVIVPADSPLSMDSLTSLAQPGVKRIAFGNPAMPNAKYAEMAIKAAGLWGQLQPKFVLCATVVQSLNYVAQGDVDAGFVFATDAATAPGKVKVAFTVPVREPIVYPVAEVAKAPHPQLAEAFIAYLLSPDGQAVFHRYGFLPPPGAR
jgi:molybdate transport system substrate-binding protein